MKYLLTFEQFWLHINPFSQSMKLFNQQVNTGSKLSPSKHNQRGPLNYVNVFICLDQTRLWLTTN